MKFQANPREVADLIREAEEGKLGLPEFQRRFIWRPPAIADFLGTVARVSASTTPQAEISWNANQRRVSEERTTPGLETHSVDYCLRDSCGPYNSACWARRTRWAVSTSE